jgi:segregation and condensation protein A
MDYEVKLEIFEGPLDLLLHLIHKNELDIFDIPIATVTDQYLDYLDMMKALNINLASDFLVMAATLIHIKSRMLLPDFQADGEEGEDPRLEITRPLLEYMALKEAAHDLSERSVLDRDTFGRKPPEDLLTQIKADTAPELEVNLFQLIDAFRRIIEEKAPGAQLSFRLEQWSVKDKTEFIVAALKERGQLYFNELFEGDRTIMELVITFLALLELVHMGLVSVYQVSHESQIRLIPKFERRTE